MDNTKSTYTIKQLADMAKPMNYKFCCLYDNRDKKITSYNTLQTPISKHLTVIENRLKNPILPDGVYFVGMSERYGKGGIVDKYPIIKGSSNGNSNSYTILQPQNFKEAEHVLSYDSAIALNRQVSTLENKLLFSEAQNKLLAEKIARLESDLKDSENSLSEIENTEKNPLSDFAANASGWLKDIAPMLAPLADRYFDLQEKKVLLETKKVDSRGLSVSRHVPEKKQIAINSNEFLDHIRALHDAGNETEMNECLDLLEQHHNDKYILICHELDLFESDGKEGDNE